MRADDLELVDDPGFDPGGEDFPYAAFDALAHLMATPVPIVPVAHHRYALSIGGPDREMRALDAFVLHHMGAEPVIEPLMASLDEKMVVELAQDGPERVGIVEIPRAAAVFGPQPVVRTAFSLRQDTFEKASGVAQRERDVGAIGLDREQALGMRNESPEREARRRVMQPEHGERVAVAGGHDRCDIRVTRLPSAILHDPSLSTYAFLAGTSQMSSAYSRIVRSEENQPTRAVFRALDRHHEAGSRHFASTSRWRRIVGVEICRDEEMIVVEKTIDPVLIPAGVVGREDAGRYGFEHLAELGRGRDHIAGRGPFPAPLFNLLGL